jgi:hypothetical protein
MGKQCTEKGLSRGKQVRVKLQTTCYLYINSSSLNTEATIPPKHV